jgi:hypothetical protein
VTVEGSGALRICAGLARKFCMMISECGRSDRQPAQGEQGIETPRRVSPMPTRMPLSSVRALRELQRFQSTRGKSGEPVRPTAFA